MGVNEKSDAHLALDSGTLQYYVVGRPRSGNLCLLVRHSRSRAVVSTCGGAPAVNADAVIWISHPKAERVFDVYALAPDAFSEASIGSERTQIANNVFLLRDVPASEHVLRVQGSGASTQIDLGPHA